MRQLIDLTKPLNDTTRIFQSGDYRDPPLVISDWCRIEQQAFWVSALEMGTQTGTHIDAPAHLLEDGPLLEELEIQVLIGDYFLVRTSEVRDQISLGRVLHSYSAESILFLVRAPSLPSLTPEALEQLLSLGCKLWVAMGDLVIDGRDSLHLHRRLAQEGVYLVEDLDDSRVDEIQPDGELVILPLRLEGVSGSPCRVILRR